MTLCNQLIMLEAELVHIDFLLIQNLDHVTFPKMELYDDPILQLAQNFMRQGCQV